MANRRGHAGRVDLSQKPIVDGLRKAGITAHSIATVGDGVPDVVAGWHGVTVLLETKTGNAGLTAAERAWHETWGGQVAVVRTPEETITAVIAHVRNCGRLE